MACKVTRHIAFSETSETTMFDDFFNALAQWTIWKSTPDTHWTSITDPETEHGQSWTAPRFLDLRDMGGEKGADFDKMQAYTAARIARHMAKNGGHV